MAKRKNPVLEYLITHLEECGEDVQAKTKEIVPGLKTDYLLVEDDGIVLAIDRHYTKESFSALYQKANKERKQVAVVLLNNGKTFFRSAAKKVSFKRERHLSLKAYSDEDIQKIIECRPEEIHLINQIRVNSVHKKQQPFVPSKAQTHAIILFTLDTLEKLFKS